LIVKLPVPFGHTLGGSTLAGPISAETERRKFGSYWPIGPPARHAAHAAHQFFRMDRDDPGARGAIYGIRGAYCRNPPCNPRGSGIAACGRKSRGTTEGQRTAGIAHCRAEPSRTQHPDREMALRLVAMVAMGAIRLATEALGHDGEQRSLVKILHATFDALKAEVTPTIDGQTQARR
jgi:hypothetical protein